MPGAGFELVWGLILNRGATVPAAELRNVLGGPLAHEGIPAGAVAEALAGIGMRGTIASAGRGILASSLEAISPLPSQRIGSYRRGIRTAASTRFLLWCRFWSRSPDAGF